MSESPAPGAPATLPLPDAANLEWLRKQAKQRLKELRQSTPDAKLADAQLALARSYGFPSWRALKAHLDSLTVEGQLFEAARRGDAVRLAALLDAHPDKLDARDQPYEFTLLHAGARHLAVVELLVARGLDANARERGDNTYAMHWAAAAGAAAVVTRLVDAGGDVIGHGDDHELDVIGWATCWEGCDTDAHRAVVDILLAHGARHHIYSAIAMNLADEVRRIVASDPSALNRRMSRNEDHQLPLHFAVRISRPAMVALLIALGADPLGVDASGYPAAMYAVRPDVDRPVMESIRAMTSAERRSAERGQRRSRLHAVDLLAALALGDWHSAEQLWSAPAGETPVSDLRAGALHVMSKRGDLSAVHWLLAHGADPNARWPHWDADVTPLHLAALGGHAEVARALLHAGADPTIRDTKHDGDARGWAEFFGRSDILAMLLRSDG